MALLEAEKHSESLYHTLWRQSGYRALKRLLLHGSRRIYRDHGRIRVRQNHTAEHPGRARPAHQRRSPSGCGMNLSQIREKDIAAFRRDHLGFVFQDFNLLDTFSLRDNIFLPMVLAGKNFEEMNQRLIPIAKKLDIVNILDKYPYEVSGGQKQRAAVARALITQPKLILADEPSGALDSRATDRLLQIFHEINFDGQTILMVTHSTKAASHANRVLFIKDGVIFHQLYRGNDTNEQMYQKISDTLTMLTTGGDCHE